jgi:DNA ligase 1
MSDFFDLDVKKSYPKLYSRDTKGKIRIWWMDQENEKYRACAGIEGGQIVVSDWTTAEGKNQGQSNETLPTDQATKEVLAKYKKQRETGYFDSKADVDNFQYFQPMLAHKWLDHKDKIDLSKGVWISPKLDGVRCVFTKDGCFSRNGKRFISFPHIGRELKKLFAADPNLILDGEIYNHTLKEDFDKIISLAKKTKPTPEDIRESEKHLQYWIFDIPSVPGDYDTRYAALKKLVLDNFRDNKWIRLCIHKLVHSEAEIEHALADWLLHKFEGVMINARDGIYLNKRSTNLLKYKLFQDEDFEIIAVNEGTGNRSGMMGFISMRLPNGKTFDSNARGDEEKYKKMLKDKDELYGLMATVRFQNYTPDGIPRFPVIVAIRDYE